MSNHSNQPKTFGERFKDEGLTGILKNKNKDAKSNPNEMHFLEHLEELRWVIFKAVTCFPFGLRWRCYFYARFGKTPSNAPHQCS